MPKKPSLKFKAKCLICSWVSDSKTGPVFAGWAALRHAKKTHPNMEGVVAVIEKIQG